MSDWSLSIAAWVIQDGNYADFTTGQRVELAVEFYPPEPLSRGEGGARSAVGTRSAVGDGDGWYSVDATVAALVEDAWFLDCGILVFQDQPPPEGIGVGDAVRGRVLLSVDPFFYFESHARRPEVPAAIYTWDLLRIRRETAPYVLDDSGVYVRDESRRKLVEVDATDAWHDDGGFAEYVFDCRLLDVPPKRTSATAI
ncbi:MAG TPA: hypothetical protein VHF89_06565 [Solirubrobacteraceae bacterium]|nr:hypothetical protein [Solirubrobacteraceae bacterium]